jgi:hypothetical protein
MFDTGSVSTISERQPARSILTMALVCGLLGVVGVPAAAPARAAAEECQGQPATIVGTPEMTRLRGTGGADVIVTGGARRVFARGGSDLVCVTRGTEDVDTAAGEDLVDTVAASLATSTRLGEGDDTFIGGARADDVDGGPGSDTVDTGAGRDDWRHGDAGDVAFLGEGNDSAAATGGALPSGAVDGGPGRNTLTIGTCCDDEGPAWVIDNVTETAAVDGVPSFQWDNFRAFRLSEFGFGATVEFLGSAGSERLDLFQEFEFGVTVERLDMGGGNDSVVLHGVEDLGSIDGGSGTDWVRLDSYADERGLFLEVGITVDLARDLLRGVSLPTEASIPEVENVAVDDFATVLMRGDDQANSLRVGQSCLARLHGFGGPDLLSAHPRSGCRGGSDGPRTVRATGGQGNDLIWGRRTNDRLIGGPGLDAVDGRRGIDTCEAEITAGCERVPR